MSCCLYRHFSSDKELLYVGISVDGYARTKAHHRHSAWFPQVAEITIEHLETRESAINAEKIAIAQERPKFNVMHNRPRFVANEKPDNSKREMEFGIVSFQPLYSMVAAARKLDLSIMRIKKEIDERRLAYIEIGAPYKKGKMTTANRRRMITGWQLLDWLEYKQEETFPHQKRRHQAMPDEVTTEATKGNTNV